MTARARGGHFLLQIWIIRPAKPISTKQSWNSSEYVTIGITSLPGSADRLPFVQRLIAFYQVLHILSRNPLCFMRAPALLHESALAHSKQKTGTAFWPTPWPTNRKTGAKTTEKSVSTGDGILQQIRLTPLKRCGRRPYRIFTRMRPLVRVQ